MAQGRAGKAVPGGVVDGEIRCGARLENLELIRSFVEHACQKAGGDPAACFSLKLAVDEACTNLIFHGYTETESGEIAIAFSDDEDRMVVTITDQAPPFAPGEIPRPDREPGWEGRAPSGLGWHLIQRTMDGVEYFPDPRLGNRLVLTRSKASRG